MDTKENEFEFLSSRNTRNFIHNPHGMDVNKLFKFFFSLLSIFTHPIDSKNTYEKCLRFKNINWHVTLLASNFNHVVMKEQETMVMMLLNFTKRIVFLKMFEN